MDASPDLRKLVVDELAWDPSMDASGIRVGVVDGAVSLTGTVQSYAEKLQAARAARRVVGVRSVDNHLVVRLPDVSPPDDRSLFEAAQHALRWNILVPRERIQVGVRQGWVTLDGVVGWPFQRKAAEHALRHLRGVRGVINHIRIQPRVTPESVGEKVTAAFQRNAELEARHIHIQVNGGHVVLSGTVESHAEREAAEHVAWLAPGIIEVDNRLEVEPVHSGEAAAAMSAPLPPRDALPPLHVATTRNRRRTTERDDLDRITAGDLMQREVVTIAPGARVRELAELLSHHQIGGVPVVDAAGAVVGVVSANDVVRMTARHAEMPLPAAGAAALGPERSEYFASIRATPQLLRQLSGAGVDGHRVADIMTPATFSVREEATLRQVAGFLLQAGIHRALVMRDGKLRGIVSTMDVLRGVVGEVGPAEPPGTIELMPE
jgi:osmotically-inducible protein OsmY/CBS domain-containing protein